MLLRKHLIISNINASAPVVRSEVKNRVLQKDTVNN
jgi:hypothetical protein